MAEPWQKAEIPGPMKALVITKADVVPVMVKKAKKPLLVVGPEAVDTALGNEKLIDWAIRVAKVAKIPVVATAHIVGEFVKRGSPPTAWMPAMDIANRLKDRDWKGVDGKGAHDLALFLGIHYYVQWLILSGLKHFSSLTTISLDRYYQPHASWSFPNLSAKDWFENLKVIEEKLGGKK